MNKIKKCIRNLVVKCELEKCFDGRPPFRQSLRICGIEKFWFRKGWEFALQIQLKTQDLRQKRKKSTCRWIVESVECKLFSSL